MGHHAWWAVPTLRATLNSTFAIARRAGKLLIMSRSPITDADREEVAEFIERHWHSRLVVNRGRSYYPHEEPGFLARRDGQLVGVLTYHIHDDGAMELLTLNSTLEGAGIGFALMLDVIHKARQLGCPRIGLATTNDNLHAIGFYQRLGFHMTEIRRGAVDAARKIKPQIPMTGERGVPMHDEVIMELELKPFLDPESP